MRIKELHDSGKWIYYITSKNTVDKCQFECKTSTGKNYIRILNKNNKYNRIHLPSDTIFWTTEHEAQQHLDKILKKRRLDFSKLKISDKVITTEESLKDVEPFNLDDIRGCIVKESIEESFKQIGEYKQGKRKFKSLKDNQALWDKWVEEVEEENMDDRIETEKNIIRNEKGEVVLTKEERMSAKADLLYDDDTYIADMYEESENAIK